MNEQLNLAFLKSYTPKTLKSQIPEWKKKRLKGSTLCFFPIPITTQEKLRWMSKSAVCSNYLRSLKTYWPPGPPLETRISLAWDVDQDFVTFPSNSDTKFENWWQITELTNKNLGLLPMRYLGVGNATVLVSISNFLGWTHLLHNRSDLKVRCPEDKGSSLLGQHIISLPGKSMKNEQMSPG